MIDNQEVKMKQFCATVYIIESEKILLIYHRKLQKWLPPGGHIEPNETPPQCAKREALEETGYEIDFLRQENVWIEDNWNANSFERPFMCLLEEIPQYKDQPSHQHMDFIYVGRLIGGEMKHNPEETEDIRWFSLAEIDTMQPDKDIFVETMRSAKVVLETFSVPVT